MTISSVMFLVYSMLGWVVPLLMTVLLWAIDQELFDFTKGLPSSAVLKWRKTLDKHRPWNETGYVPQNTQFWMGQHFQTHSETACKRILDPEKLSYSRLLEDRKT